MSGYVFVPRYRFITDIVVGKTTVVTCSEDHDFSDGEIVSFRVSQPFGTVQLNNKQGRVLSHTSDTITVEIDSQGNDAFIYPVSGEVTPPVVVPSSSGIVPGLYVPTMNLEDVFDNQRS